MSAEDDLKRYRRDQDLFFQELEDKQRHSQQLVKIDELAHVLERAGVDIDPFVALKRQLLKLGLLSGMSKTKAEEWAHSLIVEALALRLQTAN